MIRWWRHRRAVRAQRERLLYLLRVWRHLYRDDVWEGDDLFLFHLWVEILKWRGIEEHRWY